MKVAGRLPSEGEEEGEEGREGELHPRRVTSIKSFGARAERSGHQDAQRRAQGPAARRTEFRARRRETTNTQTNKNQTRKRS